MSKSSLGQALAQLGELVVPVGGKRPLVITDKGIVAAGIADKTNAALKSCGVEGVLFDGVEPPLPAGWWRPPGTSTLKEGCDLVIGLGGPVPPWTPARPSTSCALTRVPSSASPTATR